MSLDGIDHAYEEQVKAETPKLLLYVDGSLKLTTFDTPSGRRQIDKAAFLAVESSDDVTVVPLGAGERKAPRARKEAGGSPVPAPSRTTCCEPESYAGPSGVRKRHRFDCPSSPGTPIGRVTAQVADISQGRLAREHRMQSRHVGLDEAMADHPAGGVLTATDEACPVHPGERWDDCIACSGRLA